MNRRSLVTLGFVGLSGLAVACGGKGGLSEEDAQKVFLAMYTVGADVQSQAFSAVSAAGKDLSVSSSEDGYAFSGSISGTGLWTGTIEVSGSMTYTDTHYEYAFSMDFVEVNVVSQDLTLDGSVDWDLMMDTSDDGSFTYEYGYSGSLEVSGSVEGTADFDFSIVAAYDASTGTYTYTAEGDLGGNDVGEFSGQLSTGG